MRSTGDEEDRRSSVMTDGFNPTASNEWSPVTPRSSRALLGIRNCVFKTKCEYYRIKNRVSTGRIHNYGVQLIDPARIEYITAYTDQLDYSHQYLDIGAFDRFKWTGSVVSGDWDRSDVKFSELYVYRAILDHYERGVPWSETQYFSAYKDAIERGDQPWGCQSVQELYDRCAYIDSLYQRIQREGYQSQRDLNKYSVDEVNVNVGRNGTILFNDGRHRLAIAKVLQLDAIPVRILVVHEEFNADADWPSPG